MALPNSVRRMFWIVCAGMLLQTAAGQSQAADWSCTAENDAVLASGIICPPFADTSCSGILALPQEAGRKTASYLASLLADLAYEPSTGTWEDTAMAILPGWGATDVQFISKTRAGKVKVDTQVAVADTPAAVLVFFRGTTKKEDIETDLATSFKDVSGLGRVHEGFFEAYAVAHADISSRVDIFRAGSKPVIYAGHSLGGALAMVAAAWQQLFSPGSVGAVYTFGAPRVGDAAWAAAYEGLGLAAITYRYVLGKDPIALLPPGGSIGFVHVGRQVHISNGRCEEVDAIQDYCEDGSTTIVQNIDTLFGDSALKRVIVGVIGDKACANKENGSLFADWAAKPVFALEGLNLSLKPSDLTRNDPGICCSDVADHMISNYKAAVRTTCMSVCDVNQLCLCETFFLQPQPA